MRHKKVYSQSDFYFTTLTVIPEWAWLLKHHFSLNGAMIGDGFQNIGAFWKLVNEVVGPFHRIVPGFHGMAENVVQCQGSDFQIAFVNGEATGIWIWIDFENACVIVVCATTATGVLSLILRNPEIVELRVPLQRAL